ncbi:MAG: hypothetical protein SPI12_06420, partial [Actinomycetaceae bacterium]|nr:hypothetical protein [Actinomycetaceae bacterium]MDY6083472.1 hypothetical protein [Actinomycetaceae bacterium]
MKKKNLTLTGLAGTALLLATSLLPAHADTIVNHYPETPTLNPTLPIINTYHGADHLKANILNPHPVCNAAQDYRTVIYRVDDHFLPVGTISAHNQTNSTIPLTQTTSKAQSISLSINGSKTESISFNGSGSKDNVTAGISMSLTKTLGLQGSYSLSWNVGQQIGPYNVPSGYTGEATYGFRAITMSGTLQTCLPNGTWANPTAYTAFVPIKNDVRVRLYNNPADAAVPAGEETHTTVAQPTAQPTSDQATPNPGLDLEPYLTVSDLKAKGFAGSVALHIKNTGTQRYYADFPAISFKVEVKTAAGPQGVDRLITTLGFKGATVRDLGFNEKTSTRTFMVTLSNPILAGEQQTVAAFSFGDG